MQRPSSRAKQSRRPARSRGLEAGVVASVRRAGTRTSGELWVSIRAGERWVGVRPRLLELEVQRVAARIAALPEAQVAAELERAERSHAGLQVREPDAGAEASDGYASLDRAFARGDRTRDAWGTRSDLLTGEAFAAAVGLSRATVDNRRRAGKLLALELGAKRGVRYPAWQCGLLTDAALRTAFERVLSALVAVGAASAARFFTRESPALGGSTPLAALSAGETAAVLRAARTWARGEQGGG